MFGTPSLVPGPPPQLLLLAVRIIRTPSDDSCGGGLGMRLWDSHSWINTERENLKIALLVKGFPFPIYLGIDTQHAEKAVGGLYCKH